MKRKKQQKARPLVLICDDETTAERKWHEALERVQAVKGHFDVKGIDESKPERVVRTFREEIAILERRRSEARKGKDSGEPSIFDEASILIVDFDLIRLDQGKEEVYLTGESVAYLARCYSRCKIILALNQFGDNVFDLTLKGHPESFADLNLGGSQVHEPGLWGEHTKRFCPWAWPSLPKALADFDQRIQDIKNNMDRPILEFLEFPASVVSSIPNSILAFIAGGTKKPQEVTFEDFLEPMGNGLKRKDAPWPQAGAKERIAVARISKWLERMVLPGQDILVDAPHLVLRYPSLLKKKATILESWNATTFLAAPLDRLGIHHEKISRFAFKKAHWLSRPAWFWRELSECQDIEEVARPWSSKAPDVVFCEDTSRFVRHDKAKEFAADLPSPFVRRYVEEVARVTYKPAVRFSM
ncbi:hypothetical protein [Hyalangium rubrum]|uniref:Uncharacterized protein n=1 Tax=Hyalangium rubrum TaxID=3103134 RepID=A0ABU5HA88_9BACT|nr:hypothetical protein [Hyalangium sp. s54d21]MDY7229030.1 hypothetical protein [Hyalangium sp. s54d21]